MAPIKRSRVQSARVLPQTIFELPQWKSVSSDARTMWIMILCGRHSSRVPGLALASVPQLADEMDWDDERTLAALTELAGCEAIVADIRASTIYCPHIIRGLPDWALSVDPEWVVSWMRPVPESELRTRIAKDLAKFFGLKPKDY